jgi:hypothetical protein
MVYSEVLYDLERTKKRVPALDALVVARAIEAIKRLAEECEELRHGKPVHNCT